MSSSEIFLGMSHDVEKANESYLLLSLSLIENKTCGLFTFVSLTLTLTIFWIDAGLVYVVAT